jgi:osmotically-inducible protein OsmY
VLLTAAVCGCGGDDAERLARIGRKTAARCDGMTAGLRDRVAAGVNAIRTSLPARGDSPGPAAAAAAPSQAPSTPPASVNSTPIDARVRWRIRWDKALAGADVQVDSPSGGVVQLRGVVNDLSRQRRAVELAESTEGVDRVISELGLKQP